MSIRAGDGSGLSAAAKLVADRARSVVRLELQLAAAELKKKAATLGVGLGLLAAAALFAFFMVGFALAAIAAGLATGVSWWLALLIVTLGLLVLAAALAAVGVPLVKKSVPPVPEHALEEAKRTAEVLKNGR
jgi:membrane protein implicated in regulation of membrane protease activity